MHTLIGELLAHCRRLCTDDKTRSGHAFTKPSVKIDDTVLNAVDNFCYLGSVLSQDANIYDDMTKRVGATNASF